MNTIIREMDSATQSMSLGRFYPSFRPSIPFLDRSTFPILLHSPILPLDLLRDTQFPFWFISSAAPTQTRARERHTSRR